ncbi:MAG: quinolinate synthase [Ignavibacteria bacterium GWB2_35_12]|nr:MAG: quinolinate synthase [Ignavibacteria bacterium GWA2_35_8]OGU38052.1 MAG: quinolinate synthase [Ignavibacteria bacterium GWB2_35_12]OGU87480.1 MAG: quinolinate synthase [Ignavibacteria bacterium RIFOXYA2_FULL_35_10]OGV25026.1 MAG: quinolinate synthase [Ignavibacteria bacterium RIFOXYC2_FULL_35_21]
MDLIEKLYKLKKERNAVILAHYYQDNSIQDVADFLGDSLALAQKAKQTNADVILFCGVHFMAETAKILNPAKIVLMPDLNAGCSLADSAPADKFEKWVKSYPGNYVISYINCSTHVKAMSDIICTSSNAEKIVNSVPINQNICFAPDKHLGAHIIKKTGRKMVLWDGTCQVHIIFSELEVINLMNKHPEALLIAHPECPENILQYADFIGSTTSLLNYTISSDANEFIVATEPGIIHQMEKKATNKKFYPIPNLDGCSCNECPHMKLNTLEKMIAALENMKPEILIPEDLRLKALIPLERMLELS